MVNEKMCVGIIKDELMVRIGEEKYTKALKMKGCKEMNFTGRPMKGYVYVEPTGFKTEKSLKKWVEKGVTFVKTLPPKKPKK